MLTTVGRCAVTTQEDYRDIIVTAGEDPYAYRGIADLKQPYVNPHRWLPEPGEPPRTERTEAERDAALLARLGEEGGEGEQIGYSQFVGRPIRPARL